jgi:hypothetical protein
VFSPTGTQSRPRRADLSSREIASSAMTGRIG